MDAITLLKNDHRTVEKLFKSFEKAGDRAFTEKRGLVDKMIEELSIHAGIEEMLFYPVTRATVPKVEDEALESIEEHHIVKWVLSELEDLDPKDERFDAKVTVLIENVRHHVEEEESDYFTVVRDELGRKALSDLGDAMVEAKSSVPTHPHPRSPMTPPGNVAVGSAAALVDRIGDTVSGAAQGGVAAAQDLINRIRGSRKPVSAPQGSSKTRKTAAKIRAGSDQVVEELIGVVQDAKSTGKSSTKNAKSKATKTAKAAKTGTKRTAASARKGARNTVTTAKQGATSTRNTAKAS